jgi:hypothetical protein
MLGAGLLVSLFMPNTLQIMSEVEPAAVSPGSPATGRSRVLRWRASVPFAAAASLATFLALLLMSRPSEFLYFQF